MMDLLRMASGDLAAFLNENLPKISDNWWQKHVIDRLTFQQQRTATERGFTSTKQLDWAALLRVLAGIGLSFPGHSDGRVMAGIG